MDLKIRTYRIDDEEEWLKCHMLVDLKASGGELLKEKPKYEDESIELVATVDGKIIGFLDIELESSPGKFCHRKVKGNGMLWDIGVLKECRRQGVATKLLDEGIRQAKRHNIQRLEAWTVEEGARPFYENFGFKKFYEYHHVLIDKREKLKPFNRDGMRIVSIYAHVLPDANIDALKEKYEPKSIHLCTGFEILV